MHVQSETEGLGVLILTGQLISLDSMDSLGIRKGAAKPKDLCFFRE